MLQIHIFKDRKAVGLQWAGICVDKEDCAQTDGMEKDNRDWGVVFKVAEKMKNEGCRSQSPPQPPTFTTHTYHPHPLLALRTTLPTALSNLRWGCVFMRRQGFTGWMGCCRERKAGMKSRSRGKTSSSSSLHKPVHSKDGPFNLH